MKLTKKIMALALALVSLVSFAACNTAGGDPTTAPVTGTGPTTSSVVTTTPEKSSTATPENTTATVTPLPSAEPTPTTDGIPTDPKEFYEYNSNYNLNTEEGIGVLKVGKYKITFTDGTVLSYTESGLTTGGDKFDFSLQFQNAGNDRSGKVGYMVMPGDTLERSLACSGSSVSLKTTAYRNNYQVWNLIENADGSYCFVSKSGDTKYLSLSKEDGKLYAKGKNTEGFVNTFNLELISEGNGVWDQYISEKGNIIIRIKKQFYTSALVKKERIAKLVNDMQTVYETYQDLTSFTPYDSIIIHIFQDEKYFAYVVGGYNIISFNYNNAVTDLRKMQFRTDKEYANDWSFCLMHEMGHMFDWNRGWRFDGESATNIKLAYALWANLDKKAVAAQSGYSYKDYFDGNTISETWKSEAPMKMEDGKTLGEKVVRTCYIFSTYALNEIGWEAFRKSYHEINALEAQPTDVNVRLKIFTDALEKHGGKHIKDYIGEEEWNVLVAKCAGN
ncbi:MAG: hypothetical protein E7675_00180 [Ruminococcaceae bacterium]|nr:hypothetical protein [Oscillospiraceae bacterium]